MIGCDKDTQKYYGVPLPTQFYVDVLVEKAMDVIYRIFEEEEFSSGKTVVNLDYTKISKLIKKSKYHKMFPVSEINLLVEVNKKPRHNTTFLNKYDGKYYPYSIGGYALPFAKNRSKVSTKFKCPVEIGNKHSISLYFGVTLDYNDMFNSEYFILDITDRIESTIQHELNHLYEYYQRKIKKSNDIDFTLTWSCIGDNRMKRPKVIWDFWQSYFTELIYQSQPHERRAMVQEAVSFLYLPFDNFQNTRVWKDAKSMQNFDENKFLNNLRETIRNHNPSYVNKMPEQLKKDFINDLKYLSKEFKAEYLYEFLESYTFDEFMKYWGDVIRASGESLIKRLSKLYSSKKG